MFTSKSTDLSVKNIIDFLKNEKKSIVNLRNELNRSFKVTRDMFMCSQECSINDLRELNNR